MSGLGFKPVFIVGAPRSGTTFLGERLGRYADFMTTPETQFMRPILMHGTQSLDINAADALIEEVLNHFRFWTLGLSIAKEKMRLALVRKGGVGLARLILEHYQQKIGRSGIRFWVEHTPENLFNLPWLMHLLPEAKVVHLVRDGRGVLASFRSLDWGPHSARRVAEIWLVMTMSGAALAHAHPERIITLRYEDFLADEHFQMARLLRFLDSNNDAPISDHPSFVLPEFTRKHHALVGGATQKDRAEAWRTTLSETDIATFEHFARVGLCYFEYLDTAPPPLFTYTLRSAARDYLQDGWKLIPSKIRKKIRERLFVRNSKLAETKNTPTR